MATKKRKTNSRRKPAVPKQRVVHGPNLIEWLIEAKDDQPFGDIPDDPFRNGEFAAWSQIVPVIGDLIRMTDVIDGKWYRIGLRVVDREFQVRGFNAEEDPVITVIVEVEFCEESSEVP